MFVVIGTATVDFFLRTPVLPRAELGDDGFRADNLTFIEEPLRISMGGNGGNSAYVLAGLGAPTVLCSAVGNDALGLQLATWLREGGVDLRALQWSAEQATSSSTILLRDATNQIVFHHQGATTSAQIDTVTKGVLKDARVLLLTGYPIMPRWRAGGFAQALALAREGGAITALDVGPAIGIPVTMSELKPLLPDVNYVLGNSHELRAICNERKWESAAEQLLEAGAEQVVVKRGRQGAVMRGIRQADTPAFKVEAKVTAGAGDAFNAGFLYSIERGASPGQALRFGSAVAAYVVAQPNGILDTPSCQEVELFLDEQE